MSNHHHGLWGYHGHTPRELELTVQATGIGGPSAVVVLSELAELGLRRAVRVGTCVAAGTTPPAGAGLIVAGAVAEDGTSAALGHAAGSTLVPDAGLFERLRATSGLPAATVVSRDLATALPGREGGRGREIRVVDLQTAATLAFCHGRRIAAAAVLAVASSAGRRLEDEPLEGALLRLADLAVSALERGVEG